VSGQNSSSSVTNLLIVDYQNRFQLPTSAFKLPHRSKTHKLLEFFT
jgi:hypothetical protein